MGPLKADGHLHRFTLFLGYVSGGGSGLLKLAVFCVHCQFLLAGHKNLAWLLGGALELRAITMRCCTRSGVVSLKVGLFSLSAVVIVLGAFLTCSLGDYSSHRPRFSAFDFEGGLGAGSSLQVAGELLSNSYSPSPDPAASSGETRSTEYVAEC